jgi:hypothetical protein
VGKSFIKLKKELNPKFILCNPSRPKPDVNVAKLKLRHQPGLFISAISGMEWEREVSIAGELNIGGSSPTRVG